MAPPPKFLPGLRGSADWHMREARPGETPHTLNTMGGTAEMVLPTDDSFETKHTTMHEMLHAAHSPMESPKTIPNPFGEGVIEGRAIMFSEELRIGILSRALVGGEGMIWCKPGEVDNTIKGFAQLLLRAAETGDAADLTECFYWYAVLWPHYPKWPSDPRDDLWKHFEKTAGGYKEIRDNPILLEAYEFGMVITKWFHNVVYSGFRREIQKVFSTQKPYDWDIALKIALAMQQTGEAYNRGKAKATAQSDRLEQLRGQAEAFDGEDDFTDMLDRAETDYTAKPSPRGLGAAEVERTGEIATHPDRTEELKNIDKLKEVEWGKMKIKRPKLTMVLDRMMRRRSRYRAAEEGVIPRYPHRMVTDGKVFSRRRKTPGGSVLIDDSGSMHLETKQVHAIMKAAPAVIIAAYSGNWHTQGELSILAEDGRMCEVTRENLPKGSNNLVDFPALQWLAEQPEPRIWVSDGEVVPQSGPEAHAIYQCVEFCYANNINRVETAEKAHKVFTGKEAVYR